jgi:hypothetical protein
MIILVKTQIQTWTLLTITENLNPNFFRSSLKFFTFLAVTIMSALPLAEGLFQNELIFKELGSSGKPMCCNIIHIKEEVFVLTWIPFIIVAVYKLGDQLYLVMTDILNSKHLVATKTLAFS